MLTGGSKSRVERLRIRGAARDTPALRLDVAREVERAELQPPGFPPSGILLVRRVKISRPMQPRPYGSDTRWQQELRLRVADQYRGAARAEGGRVPPDAEAVFFSDEAELLAWLLAASGSPRAAPLEWLRPQARTLLGTRRESAADLLEALPQIAPAAVAKLVRWNRAVDVAARLSENEIQRALESWGDFFQISRTIVRALGRLVFVEEPPENGGSSGIHDRESTTLAAGFAEPARAPWSVTLPSSASNLAADQELLLGIAVTIHHEPTRARSFSFGAQVERWATARVGAAKGAQPRDSEEPPALGGSKPERNANQPDSGGPRGPASDRERSADGVKKRRADSPVGSSGEPRPPTASAPALGGEATGRPSAARGDADPGVSSRQASEEAQVDSAARGARESAEVESSVESEPDFGEGVETTLGGVLYLVNLMEHLDLPDCFEKDWRLASEIGSWGTLELIARALLADGLEADSDRLFDPIWRALAQIDNREPGELPGSGFRGADVYRIPEAWRQQLEFADGSLVTERADGYRRVSTPSGCVVFEEMPSWDGLRGRASGQAGKPVPPLNHWLRCAMSFIEPRLREALDLSPEQSPAEKLFAVPGRIYVTATHVDLVASVGATSLAVRRAGLDIDPGWSARMGRVILFHFE